MFDVCVIGHITRDKIRIKNQEKEMQGGVAYYATMALKNLGSDVSLITKAAEKDRYLLNDLIEKDITIFYKESQKTTFFENIYPESVDFRVQQVRSIADPFSIEDILDIHAKIFHLGPLTEQDIPLKILKLVSKKGKISLDAQGFLRKIENCEVKSADWEEKTEGLACVDILKTDENEAKILSGKEDLKKAAVELSGYGPEEIIITCGYKGSLIHSKGRFYRIPSIPPEKEVDSTGCGDTYIAGYIHKRLISEDIYESGIFASAVASLKLEDSGAFRGSEEDVRNLLKYHQMLI